MEMQNRAILGTSDAKLMKRINGTVWSSALNMFGYYLASLGLFHVYSDGLLKVLKPFEDWYLEIFLAAGGTFSAWGQPDTLPCQHLVDAVATGVEYTYTQRVIEYFCKDESQEWRAIVLVYHGFWLAVAAGLGWYVGENILEYCD